MNKLYLAAALNVFMFAGLALNASSARAQEQDTTAATSANDTGAQRSPERVVELLAAKLNLTDDQKAQITPIIADRQQQLRALKADTSLRKFKRMRKAKSIVEESDERINKILNDQQRKQYAELKKQMREEMKERYEQGGSGSK